MHWSAEPAGVNAILLRFSERMDPALSACIHQLGQRLRACLGDSLLNITPAYTTLLLEYDLRLEDYDSLLARLTPLLNHQPESASETRSEVIHIPVFYDPHTTGPDLAALAEHCQCSVEQLIHLHSSREYRVYALGFAPGFAYMGELDSRLISARRETPRSRVPAGSVAIADNQTAIYPIESPGGWHLLGRTPMKLFNVDADPPALLQPGQAVRFHAVDRDTYLSLGGTL